MGNIEHKQLGRLFSELHNQDNPSTRSQQNNQTNPSSQYITHSFDPKKQSLLQMTVADSTEIEMIMGNISLYSKQTGCSELAHPSISSLKQYYKVKKEGYCTNQSIFYMIFHGCSCCGLKDEFGIRKMMNKKFTDHQIITILKTYLAGILVYLKQFKRNIEKIDINDIGFEIFNQNTLNNGINQVYNNNRTSNQQLHNSSQKQKIRMYFIEPWLKQKREQEIITVNQVNILLQNPSPQRLQQTSHTQFIPQSQQKHPTKNNQQSHYTNTKKQLFSLLFSVGIIGLKLLQMGFVDDVYIRSPSKKVNYERIEYYLNKHLNSTKSNGRTESKCVMYDVNVMRQKLISGLKILLLSNTPKERERIYEFWNVSLDEINQLDDICLEYCDHFQTGRKHPNSTQRILQNTQPNTNTYKEINNQQPSNNLTGKLYEVENPKTQTQKYIQNQTNKNDKRFLNFQHINQPDQNEFSTFNKNYIYKLDHIKQTQFSNQPQSIHPLNINIQSSHTMQFQNNQQPHKPNQFTHTTQSSNQRLNRNNIPPEVVNNQHLGGISKNINQVNPSLSNNSHSCFIETGQMKPFQGIYNTSFAELHNNQQSRAPSMGKTNSYASYYVTK